MSIKTKRFLSISIFWLFGCGVIPQLAGTPAPTVDVEAIWTSAVVTALADFNATNTVLAASTAPTQTPDETSSSGWEAYRWSTLNEIIENHRGTVDADPPGLALFPVEENKYRVRVEYLGQSRPIPSEHRALLSTWAGMFATDQAEKYVALYEEEFLFREGKSEY